MDNKFFHIAIDGPAGSGKSTIAKLFAEKCKSFIYINTGSMFRAVSYFLLKNNINYEDETEVSNKINDIKIKLKDDLVFLINNDVEEEISSFIRTNEISNLTSIISKYKVVREKLLLEQRRIASNNNVIMDGRDIGTVVLPEANIKIFLTADIKTRAQRRLKELNDSNVSIEQIEKEILFRDENDSKREIAPLNKPKNAIEINTSNLTIEEILNKIICLYSSKNKNHIIKEIKKISKTTNRLTNEFVDIYNDIFVKQDLVSYDEIINLDYQIVDLHKEFLLFLKFNEFLIENLNTKIKKHIIFLKEVEIFNIEEFVNSDKLDLLYFSYVLINIYSVMPYLINSLGVFIYKNKYTNNSERAEYCAEQKFLIKYIYKYCQNFKKIDELELKITNLVENNSSRHKNLSDTYYNIHQKFINLFNLFLLVNKKNLKESKQVFFKSMLWNFKFAFIIVLLIIIIIITLVLIFQKW